MESLSSFSAQPSATTFTDDPGDGSDGGGMTRGANYFFGFLITFVVLLLIFVGCGIGSRRRFLARRQAMLAGRLEPWAPTTPGGEYQRPILHEKPLLLGEDDWTSIQPLSLQAIRVTPLDADQKADYDNASNGHSSSSSITDRRASRRVSDIFPSLAFLRRISTSTASTSVNDEEKQIVVEMPESVQVAVMVLMPSPPADRRLSAHRFNDDGTDKLPEYQLGVARIPWFAEFPPVQRQLVPAPPSLA